MTVLALDHVQLAMPAGGEDDARNFYMGLLGFAEVAKPAALAGRGGCWFEAGAVRLHMGVERDFVPAKKAHPALLVDDLASLLAKLQAAGCITVEDVPLEGYDRRHVFDPFGSRIELMQALGQGKTE
jgi:catechol 2,3-dioxygenase-like lactoylglutathione lyase family enzyme